MRCCIVALLTVGCLWIAMSASAWELQDRPAATGEWGFRPDDGDVTVLNPPSFTWRPENDGVAYDLEVATEPSFTEPVYAIEKTPWSAHCPDVSLPPGAYYWRYRAWDDTNMPSIWSTARQFEVPEEAAHFPKPSHEELLQRIPTEHPRLFFRPDDVAHLQALAAGPLESQWQRLLDQADALIDNPPDTTEPPKYPEDVEHKSEEWRRIWWGNRRHAISVADGAATLAFVYRLSGDERYGEAARDLMMAFCEWDPKGSTNYRYNDEAAMPLLYYPTRAYTWAYDIFTPEERERIQAVMAIRGEDCYNHLHGRRHLWRPFASHSNRAWHWLGEVATVFHDEIDDASTWLDFSMHVFYTCYPVWGGADGGWHEGQAYWVSYLRRFMYWDMVMQSIYDVNVFDRPFFKRTGDFGLYTCPPHTQTGAFGDQAILSNSQRIAQFMQLLAIAADNPYWLWYAEQHGDVSPGGYFGFLSAAQGRDLQSKTPDNLPTSAVFRDVGVAALNSTLFDGRENVQVHFKSSPYGTQSHGYNANNAFLINLRGERALIRSGRRDIHGSPHHREWMWETKSDNAILVNGEGQFPHTHQALGEITHFYTSDALDVVAGEAGDSYRQIDRWGRRILFFKPDVVLIHDVLRAPEPSTYQWLLHGEAPFEWDERSVVWEMDHGRLDIHFLTPTTLTFSQTDTFDTPPHEWAFTLDEWHFTAATSHPEQFMEFITFIRVDNADATARLEEGDGGTLVRLTMPAETAHITLSEHSFHVEMGTLEETFDDNAVCMVSE